jgi:hypothetical protein
MQKDSITAGFEEFKRYGYNSSLVRWHQIPQLRETQSLMLQATLAHLP